MIIYKCKSCGGSLEVSEGQTITTCEFCGTKQTTPTTNLVRNQNLHNRANSLRLKNEFDSAISTYQSIIAEDPKDYEAYWGLVLCRYGIEYVKDPKTEKRIPTCHRTLRKSIFEDFDYLKAVENSDVIARSQIEKEAEEIDKIQKRILVLSNKEEPYDIFISYKESDEFGNRTKDSVKAEEIYQALTKKGYKVFFSRITLETKIGSEYEPIIFAALTSAKVMLVIGSKKEHMEATWVKNEWSRFISFMERGTHYIIPCYFEMDAYDMPEELLNYQAQNMEKLGWDQDLLRGIDKIVVKKEEKTPEINASYEVIMANSLIKKASQFLEEEEFSKAKELINQALILDSNNSFAYFNLLLFNKKIKSKEELLKTTDLIDEDVNFKEALKFANKEEQEELLKISNEIKENIFKSAKEKEKNKKYNEAIDILKTIIDYKDSNEYIERLQFTIEILKRREMMLEEFHHIKTQKIDIRYKLIQKLQNDVQEYINVELFNELFSEITSYCDKTNDEYINYLEETYQKAIIKSSNANIQMITNSLELLRKIPEYKNSKELIKEYSKIYSKKKRKRNKKVLIFSGSFMVLFTILITLTFTLFVPNSKINDAISLFDDGDIYSAIEKLEKINNKKAKRYLKAIDAHEFIIKGDYENAQILMNEAGGVIDFTFDKESGLELLSHNNSHYLFSYNESDFDDPNQEGYEFSKWEVVSFDFNLKKLYMRVFLEARYELKSYTINYDINGGINSVVNPKNYNIKANNIHIFNPTRSGYEFVGWSVNGSEALYKDYVIEKGTTGILNLVANWKPNEYTIIFDIDESLIEQKTKTVVYNQPFELTKPEKEGFIFEGWYYNNMLFTNGIWNLSNDITLTPRWSLENITLIDETYAYDGEVKSLEIDGELPEGVSVVYKNNNQIDVGTYTVIAIFVYDENNYEYIQPMYANLIIKIFQMSKNVSINNGILLWDPVDNASGYKIIVDNNEYITNDTNYEIGSINSILSVAVIAIGTDNNLNSNKYTFMWTENGQKYINYGKYPQTVVSDNSLILALNNLTETNSEGYYKYDGNEYAKLKATPYRSDYKFSDDTRVVSGTTYYFKVEPIKWRIISNNDGTIQLLSEYIIDSQYYHPNTNTRTIGGKTIYSNNYEHSYIRQWLNNNFYNKAFGTLDQNAILTTLVDNSASTTNSSSNSYASNNTNDKIYLLSYRDAINSSYGFSTSTSSSNTRFAITTDYARAKGAYMNTSESTYGNGRWWLRSPTSDYSDRAYSVGNYGYMSYDNVSYADVGVRPALQIR